MEPTSASGNARSQLITETCCAVTKYRGWTAICDKELRHTGDHLGVMPDGSTFQWREEPW